MAGILIYSEKENNALELLTAGRALADELGVELAALTINNDSQAEVLAQKGARVYKINHEGINLADTVAVASAVQQGFAKLSSHIILLSSNRRGKELAGRLAHNIGAGCLTDISSLVVNGDKIECSRNALGGATVAIETIISDNKVMAIMPKSFDLPGEAPGSVKGLEVEIEASKMRILEVKSKTADTVDIEAAKIIVAVGQGLENQEDLIIIEDLAKTIGGIVACSKPIATDRKWLSEERIIGLSGKKCKPNLAILMGISGQVQFAVGIRDAKTIVAINNDENASIMQMADYIIVADLKEVSAELRTALLA